MIILFIYQPIRRSVYQSLYLSIHQSIFSLAILSTYPFTSECFPIYLLIYKTSSNLSINPSHLRINGIDPRQISPPILCLIRNYIISRLLNPTLNIGPQLEKDKSKENRMMRQSIIMVLIKSRPPLLCRQ